MDKIDKRIVQTRQKALKSAQEIFLADGIGRVTHLAVSAHSGIGRKTIYRHWPKVNDLLSDALAGASFPPSPDTGALSEDLVQHLLALKEALENGPLAYILHALNERARSDPEMKAVRDRLTKKGCNGIIHLLDRAKDRGELSRTVISIEAAAKLEGAIFYFALIRNEPISKELIVSSVAEFIERNSP